MESIVLRSRTGLVATVEGFATGAEEKPTKSGESTYYRLHLSPDENPANAVYVFCEQAHAEEVARGMAAVGAAVPVAVELTIGRRGNNVLSVKLLG